MASAKIRVFLYDSFTDRLGGGNVAGVVPGAGVLQPAQMQAIAAEISAPTTVFISRSGAGVVFRFFTPLMEIGMCGHAALAGVLHHAREAGESPATVLAPSGPLRVRYRSSSTYRREAGLGLMPPSLSGPAPDAPELLGLLGIPSPQRSGAAVFPSLVYTGLVHAVVRVDSLADLARVVPREQELASWCRQKGIQTVGVYAFDQRKPASAAQADGCSVRVRDFCPAIGAPEEPASGTTNAAIAAAIWSELSCGNERPGPGDGARLWVRSVQGAEMGRPSAIEVVASTQGASLADVWVWGAAVRSLEGRIRVPAADAQLRPVH